ncbi:TPA: hypothetical protein L7J83_005168 [Klebsiella pneumoniae]|nr:hypothetical protein [Klebsiella pneumoniae]
MTDITELAQREKFEAWARSQKLGLSYGDCGYVFSSTEMAWRAWMASSSELVEALEKAQKRIVELSEGKVGSALLERENHHVEVVGKLTEHITELESEVEKWKQEAEAWEQVAEKQLATAIELESRTVKLPAERFCPAEYAGSQLWSETEVWNKAITACADALRADGIKVEAE